MKTKIFFCMTMAMVLLSSCQDDAWDSHYGASSETPSLNVIQVLEQNPQYSDFTAVIKAQHLDTLLSQDQTFTVWAPTNDAMRTFVSDGQDVNHLLKNHINRFTYTSSDLTDTTLVRIKMLNGKFQDYQRISSGYTFAGINVEATDYIASNGLVRTLGSVAPFYLNIYETINKKDNETDSLSKYLTSFDVNEFNRDKSTAIGKNNYGQLVYDSVYNYTNEWMKLHGDLYLEDSVYTMIMPTNTGWKAGYAMVNPYFRTFGEKESETVNTVNVPTRSYALGDSKADSLTHYHTMETMASSLVFRGLVDPQNAVGDSLTATDGNVFHHPATLYAGAVKEKVSNGVVWRTDQWNYQPSDCFLKEIVVEAEETRGRYDAYASVFPRSASQTIYADSVSGLKFIEVTASTTNARTQPMVQFTIPNVLAATYDVYVVFAPAEAYTATATADSTRVNFYMNYVHDDGTMKEDPVINGVVTSGRGMTKMYVGRFAFPFANFCGSKFSSISANKQDDDCVRLRIQTNVNSNETTQLSRTMRIDYIVFEPVNE